MDSLADNMCSLDLSASAVKDSDGGSAVHGDSKDLCCICQEKCVNPISLPCSHTFCYLCVKGVAARGNKCALCRQRIPSGYLEDPQSVVNKDQLKQELEESKQKKTTWFYEAKNGGWWMYEQRTSAEIEQAFIEDKKNIRLQISGFYYVIDIEGMIQYREDHPNRRRSIKRDVVRPDSVKGIAGIRTIDDGQSEHDVS
ncbi:E3 ubiquitin-protein ligase rnf146-like [Halichondria panicea]|uniref:E3 ubiquitin-protein ligase rnf146-like n=1 Tax=Halichondria panicea TaxID=6063 RepID=UPI00312BC9AF